ncbi:MAG TPA: potassium/proton antiporter [Pilimelia sp.]|nr:potassium/proton antiporter [Pilimelia sp.]
MTASPAPAGVDLDAVLLVGAGVLLVAVAAVRLSARMGLPSLLVYLLIGVLLGLRVDFHDVQLARVLGFVALVLIIAEGGLTSRWSNLRPVLGFASVLSTVGVLVSIGAVGLVAHLALGFDWRLALLYGAVLSSTDAAAVFSTLRRLRLRPRLVAVLEAESGINDAPVALLVVLLATTPFGGRPWWQEGLLMAYELAAGAVVGLLVGLLGTYALRHAALPSAGLYPIAAVALTVLAFAAASAAHASGFLAVYAAGVVLGNAQIPHRQAVLGFADGVAWLAQIGLFIMLGLLATPSALPQAVGTALLIGGALLVLARPLSVWVSALPFRVGLREQAFLSWAGLRGAVPIVLATIPLSAGYPDAQGLFNVVFVLVVLFTLVQVWGLAPLARWLGVTARAEATEIFVDTAPLERMRANLLQLDVPEHSHLAGVYVDELRLPVGAVVTLVVRGDDGFVPDAATRLRTGDSLLIVATAEVRDATERRLRAVSRRGRLARWLGEEGHAME